jgi:deoxyadenosine/deoxycytidine kinase
MSQSIGSRVLKQLHGALSTPLDFTLPGTGEAARVFWVTIEGPIGAGKTELTKVLLPRLDQEYGHNRVFFVPEPIDELLSSGLFQRYQRDPARWAYEFQTVFFNLRTKYFRAAWSLMCRTLATTAEPQDSAQGRKVAIMLSERSIVSDTCFMRVQYRCGHCEEDTLHNYLALNAMWRELYKGVAPGLIIYCRAGSETEGIVALCQERIRSRQREAEEDLVTPDYNRIVLDEHEKLFGAEAGPHFVAEGFGREPVAIPIIVVDTTENYRDDARVALQKSGELLDVIRQAAGNSPPIKALDASVWGHVTLLGGAGPVSLSCDSSSQ